MQYQWLNKNDHKKVIVIFSGWGFPSSVFSHFLENKNDYDVLFIYDYRQLTIDLPDLDLYQSRFLIAWSFGVSSFDLWQKKQHEKKQDISFDRIIAINGTLQGVDRYMGIPPKVMQKTIDTLSQQSFREFAKRCFISEMLPKDLTVNIEERKTELEAIMNRNANESFNTWDLVWVSKKDKIFPSNNVSRAWQQYNDFREKKTDIKEIDAPHAPFHLWSNWDEVLLY